MEDKEFRKELLDQFSENYYSVPSNHEIFQEVIKRMVESAKQLGVTKVVSIQTRGSYYGLAIAMALKISSVSIFQGGDIRKRDNIIESSGYIDYNGKEKYLEMFKSSINEEEKVMIVDDWFESGNTGKAAIELIEKLKGKVVGVSILFNELGDEENKYFEKYNLKYLTKITIEDKAKFKGFE